MKKNLIVLITSLYFLSGFSQVNLNFETGDFTGWTGIVGNTSIPGSVRPVVTNTIWTHGLNSSMYEQSFHTIMSSAFGPDHFGNFPVVAPGGGSYSARLGNVGTSVNATGGPTSCTGVPATYYPPKHSTYVGPTQPPFAGAESIEQTFLVTSANAIITLQYAAVFNNGTHSAGGVVNPFFKAEVLDNLGNSIPCLTYTFVLNKTALPAEAGSTGSIRPCWMASTSSSSLTVFMPWQQKIFDLTTRIGTNVTVRFSSGGCSEGAHFGYAYVDASAGPKSLIVSGASGCTGPKVLTGPSEFGSTYSWSGPSGGITASAANSATVNATGTYSLTVGTGPCSITFTTYVNLTSPTITATPANQTVCSGANINGVSFSPSPAGATVEWTNTNASVGLPASGSGSISAYTAPNVTSQQIAYITATPSLGGCTGPAKTFSVIVNPYPVVSVGSNPTITCASGSVTLTGSSTTSGASYTWSPGGTTPNNSTTSVSNAGSYTFSASVGSCITSSVITVTSNTILPQLSVGSSPTITCLATSAVLTGSSTTSGVTYSWNPGGTTPLSNTTSVSSGGNYTLTATDPVNSCKSTSVVTVSSNTALPSPTASSATSITCNTSSVTLTGSPAAGVTYTWSGTGLSGGVNSQNATATTAGSYTLAVTATNGCTNIAVTTVSTNTTLPSPTASSAASITCNTSSVTLTGGPAAGVTYTWSGPGISGGVNNQNATATTAGSYTLAVTGTNGCTNTAVTTVNSSTVIPNISIGTDLTITCATPTVTLNGGSTTPGVTYSWTAGGATPTASTSAVTSAGIYTLTVTNPVNGCRNSLTQSVSSNTTAPTITTGSSQIITCLSRTVTLTGSSTTSGVTYSWTPGGTTPSSNTTSVTANGNYTLTVTNPLNSCRSTSVVTVTSNTTAPSATAPNGTLTCANTSTVLTGGPAAGVTYSWTGTGLTGPTNQAGITINNPGSYTLTTTAANGCTNTAVATVTNNIAVPIANAGATQSLVCGVSSVTLSGSSNPSNSSAAWSGGVCGSATQFTTTACAPGTYTLTVTHPTSGCTATGTVAVSSSTDVPQATVNAITNSITCTNTVVAIGVTLSNADVVSYTWTGPGISGATNTAATTATVAGIYSVTIINTSSNCQSVFNVTVPTNTTPVNVTAVAGASITCLTSTVAIAATPVLTDYTYSWAGPGTILNGTTANPTVNTGGNYVVTVTDNINGCTGSYTVTVPTNTIIPSIAISPGSFTTTCATPTVNLSASSSADPDASYTWTVPAGGSLSSTSISNPVANGSGVFTVAVTNTISGCISASETVTITADANTPTLTAQSNQTVICNGASATLSITGADTYTWSTTETTSSITVTPTITTTYTVAGTNTLTGCGNITGITIDVNATPTVGISSNVSSVCEGGSAVISLTGAGTYTLTDPAIVTTGTVTVTPTVATTYTVTGELQGCVSATQTISIGVNALPLLTVSDVTTCAGSSVTVTASGADTYVWQPNGELTNTISVSPTTSTSYSVVGTNTLTGCASTLTTVDVSINALPTVTATANPNTTCTSGTVTLNANTTATSFTWTTGNGVDASNQYQPSISFPASGLTTGNYVYTLTVTSSENCVSLPVTATVTIIDLPNANFDLSNLSICQNNNGLISINTPQQGVTYDWSINGQTITNTNPLNVPSSVTNTAGTYTVSVVASLGSCSSNSANTLTVNALPNVSLVKPTTSACENTAAQLDVANPNGTYSYAWSYNAQVVANGPSLSVNPLTANNSGVYTVTATDANGCNNRTTGLIDLQLCETFVPEIFTPNGDGKNDGFVIKNIENYPNNKLKIFNRWGNMVYQKDAYQNEFEGFANTGDAAGKAKLPSGTYYVILEYGDDKTETYNGYLLLQY